MNFYLRRTSQESLDLEESRFQEVDLYHDDGLNLRAEENVNPQHAGIGEGQDMACVPDEDGFPLDKRYANQISCIIPL